MKWFTFTNLKGEPIYVNRDNILFAFPRKQEKAVEPEAKAKIIGSKAKIVTEYYADMTFSNGILSKKFDSYEEADSWIKNNITNA